MKPKDKWTKSELALKCGPAELAKAIIKQWHEDGEPKCDAEAIQYWFKVLQYYEHVNDQLFILFWLHLYLSDMLYQR